ncbi:hypothetical protein GCM10009787_46050 [Streptomyces bangladeshensis]|uniref:Uncharacterized protein n=1 Tax=Streptomyces bangladeshensis TaxID=295352 RepID=A0ABN3BR20_9ACTN
MRRWAVAHREHTRAPASVRAGAAAAGRAEAVRAGGRTSGSGPAGGDGGPGGVHRYGDRAPGDPYLPVSAPVTCVSDQEGPSRHLTG